MKIAVFSCIGLGDCLLTAILSYNLVREGHEVVLFHPFMSAMQGWFPEVKICGRKDVCLEEFDRFFIFYEKLPWMENILDACLEKYRAQTTVLNPIATPNTDYPFWEEGEFDGNQTFADNLVLFCQKRLGILHPVKSCGLVPPESALRRFKNRIIIHPTSSRPGKNWPRSKFLRLAKRLRKNGFDPVFIVSPEERDEWPEAPLFSSLNEVAQFIAESGYMIGNDSGIGHLASALGLPTLSLFKNERTANFWRPSFAPNQICLPKGWLPNIKGMRWRDKYWHWQMSVGQVFRIFRQDFAKKAARLHQS
jgi:lipopolysaccharide heptosyltransferase III